MAKCGTSTSRATPSRSSTIVSSSTSTRLPVRRMIMCPFSGNMATRQHQALRTGQIERHQDRIVGVEVTVAIDVKEEAAARVRANKSSVFMRSAEAIGEIAQVSQVAQAIVVAVAQHTARATAVAVCT